MYDIGRLYKSETDINKKRCEMKTTMDEKVKQVTAGVKSGDLVKRSQSLNQN